MFKKMSTQSAREVEVRYSVGEHIRVNRYLENGDGNQVLLSVTHIEPDDSSVVQYYDGKGEVNRTVRIDRHGRPVKKS